MTKTPYIIKLGAARTRFQVERVLRVMDASNLENEKGKSQVGRYETAECLLMLDHPLALDRADVLAGTSRFVVVYGYEIRGGGIVLEDLLDSETGLREGIWKRDAHWITSDVTQEERTERFKQHPCLVIISGQKGVGRKRVARALESHLFYNGNFVYYLGMGSVVYGVDADIHGRSGSKFRREHIRRMAEIANIFANAGIILIITAVEITMADLELFHTILDPTGIVYQSG